MYLMESITQVIKRRKDTLQSLLIEVTYKSANFDKPNPGCTGERVGQVTQQFFIAILSAEKLLSLQIHATNSHYLLNFLTVASIHLSASDSKPLGLQKLWLHHFTADDEGDTDNTEYHGVTSRVMSCNEKSKSYVLGSRGQIWNRRNERLGTVY